MELKISSAKAIANYMLQLGNPEIGDIISNLKLQKLLYYAQGVHLAYFQKPLFEDEIHAWPYGPVVEIVYHNFKNFGSNAIFLSDEMAEPNLLKPQFQLINRVFSELGQYSGWKLSAMTHDENPWKLTPLSAIISKEMMTHFFEKMPLVQTMKTETSAEKRQKAAAFLLADYENSQELTAFSAIHADDFYEM
jgi:uncharacterized phage-associated protein